MVTKGYYPLEPANPQMATKIGSMYQVVPENQDRITQFTQKYESATEGNSERMYQFQ